MPIFKRLAPLVPMSFVLLLVAYTSHSPEPQVTREPTAVKSSIDVERGAIVWQGVEDEGVGNLSAGAPALMFSILEHAFELIGTPYRLDDITTKGFGCNGFVGYPFCEEAGIKLPRSIRELINMDVPLTSKDELQPGGLLFFSNRDRGRASHAGICTGDSQSIYSASRRSGGVRVDSPDSSCWSLSYMEAKRVFKPSCKDTLTSRH